MAVELVISATQQSANRILFSETTPADATATDNLTDWDDGFHLSPNPARSDIYQVDATLPASFLAITDTTGSLWEVDLITLANPLYVIGQNNAFNPAEITPDLIGLSATANFPDGKYSISQQTQGQFGPIAPQTGFAIEATIILYCYAVVECCVNDLFIAAQTSCSCSDKKLLKAQKADGWLTALKAAIDCEKYDKADEFLSMLQEICADSDCGCGCSDC